VGPLIPRLVLIVLYDIVRSNIAVASIILRAGDRNRKSGFMNRAFGLADRDGACLFALVILTSTPGTAWLDYNSGAARC
jgi:multicomponent K+:H+ antiporter subunit E